MRPFLAKFTKVVTISDVSSPLEVSTFFKTLKMLEHLADGVVHEQRAKRSPHNDENRLRVEEGLKSHSSLRPEKWRERPDLFRQRSL